MYVDVKNTPDVFKPPVYKVKFVIAFTLFKVYKNLQ